MSLSNLTVLISDAANGLLISQYSSEIKDLYDHCHCCFVSGIQNLLYKTMSMKNPSTYTYRVLARQSQAKIYQIHPVIERKKAKLYFKGKNKTKAKLPLFDTRPYLKAKKYDCL